MHCRFLPKKRLSQAILPLFGRGIPFFYFTFVSLRAKDIVQASVRACGLCVAKNKGPAKHPEMISSANHKMSFDKGLPELIQKQRLFSESIFAHLPIGIEIYDSDGVLRSINNHALRMYGVDDQSTVVDKVNLFKSPYVDEELLAKIRAGEEIVLEFEYDFDKINSDAYYTSRNKNSMIYQVKIVAMWGGESREIIGHILLTNDVTETKEEEFRTGEDKKNLEMAMDAANMSSWVYDIQKETFSTLYGNPVIRKFATLEALLERTHPQDRERLTTLFARLIDNEIRQGQITLRIASGEDGEFRHYESRMRLSSELRGKQLIVGTQLDVTEKIRMAKKTQDLLAKRELAMQVSNIVHWDFDVRTGEFESYNDPVNDFVSDRLVSVAEYLDVVHPEDRSAAYDTIQSMASGQKVNINFTCRIQTKYDESWQYCNIIGVPFEYGEHGEIIRFTGFRQNISKQQQLDEELRERNYKMELTFKNVGMSYWDFDLQTRQFKAFNDPVNDFHSEKAITPEEYLAATHPEDEETVRKYVDFMLAGTDKDFNFKYRSRTKWDQAWQSLVVSGIPAERNKKGEVIRYTGIRLNNTQWEEMARKLTELKEQAELSDRLKSAFLANMSHEIRTPLNAIVGFSELLVDCDDPEEKAEYQSIIESNNELLLRLINDILDLSKIESGILERKPEKFNLAEVCSELHTMILPKITNSEVELHISGECPDCWIFLDRNRLKQVWMNYLTNAVKCTQSGHIKLGYSVEKNGIRFYVEDTGAGIPLELQERVFGRFQKLNEFAQGTGLGLAISKAIIEAAGGEVGFSSEPGVGSTFWAWVPCEIQVPEQEETSDPDLSAPQSAPEVADGGKIRILVAEDNDSNYSLVRHILKDYDLIRAENGVEAVERIRNEQFSFVLMDLKMPVMDGLEATRRIREFNARIPIIALTANAFDSDRAGASDAGCNAFLTKPVKKSQLFELLTHKW